MSRFICPCIVLGMTSSRNPSDLKFDIPAQQKKDMVNYTAVQTILSSGNVYALPRDQFPNGGMHPSGMLRDHPAKLNMAG